MSGIFNYTLARCNGVSGSCGELRWFAKLTCAGSNSELFVNLRWRCVTIFRKKKKRPSMDF